ncbi:hypothetical protein ACH4PU_21900 [Streptomyces sp. NPDC021100]|uniref:hypothetical protein n=1 Tax=Streptomyces sp. NPDC021100 TaxID=3365114 RepID=UPI0037969A2C
MALPQLYRNRITALVAVTVFGFAGTLTAAVTAEAVGRSAAAGLPTEADAGTGPAGRAQDGRPAGGDASKTVVVVRGGTSESQALPRP